MSILLTIYAGFTHAFESDHIIAVSNMVVKRNKIIKAMKEGMFWGLGHTSTILLIGILFLFLKYKISPNTYKYLEAIV
ncbi:MAG: urease accessory protein, partial [Bacteroidetes bacterium]|nr:urease accessory protein [Bacteroidota bacterium]